MALYYKGTAGEGDSGVSAQRLTARTNKGSSVIDVVEGMSMSDVANKTRIEKSWSRLPDCVDDAVLGAHFFFRPTSVFLSIASTGL